MRAVQPGDRQLPAQAASAASHSEPHPTFWQKTWVQNVLPFVTSVSCHAVILVIGLLFYAAVQITYRSPHEEQLFVPNTDVVKLLEGVGVPSDGPNDLGFRKSLKDSDAAEKMQAWSNRRAPSVDLPGQSASDEAAGAQVIQVGFSNSIGSGLIQSRGLGRPGNGDPNGSDLWGHRGGNGIGVGSIVFQPGGGARRIAYVCDASGSMINKMPSLKNELVKAIVGLRLSQSFNAIFFQEAKCISFVENSMALATPENKRKAAAFLDSVVTVGGTDPIPGIEHAFRSHPQLIFLLTDGEFPDNDAVLRRIRELNKDHAVKINTIAFVDQGDQDVEFKKFLETIAKENGGAFKIVNEGDL